jgi:hypothetical protein
MIGVKLARKSGKNEVVQVSRIDLKVKTQPPQEIMSSKPANRS